MEAPVKTVLNLTISFDLEIEFDSFKGRNLSQFIEMIEDDILDAVEELRPEIHDVYNIKTKINND